MQQVTLLVVAAALLFQLLAPAASTAAVTGEDDAKVPAVAPNVISMSMLFPAARIAPPRRPTRLLGFSWGDCGGPGTWVKVQSVSLQPDPVDLNGPITVSVAFTAAHSFGDGQPLAASVVMKKKIFGTWVKLPCINNVGSCDYADLCTSPPPPATCPPDFDKAKVPCKCPFPAGNFSLPGYTFTVDASKIPKFLESGSYQASVDAHSAGNQVLCVNVELTLA